MKKVQQKEEVVVKEKKPKVELVSYSVKAIIPTGAYSNIQPEVVVKAKTLEEAERAVMPHIEKLFAKYRDGVQITPVAEVKRSVETPIVVEMIKPEISPKAELSTPFARAKQAIDACQTSEALALIQKRIEVSDKLVASEKTNLQSIASMKEYQLFGKKDDPS